MSLLSIRNKIKVIHGHAGHLSQAVGELPQLLAANPEVKLSDVMTGPATNALTEAAEMSDIASSAITAILNPKPKKKP